MTSTSNEFRFAANATDRNFHLPRHLFSLNDVMNELQRHHRVAESAPVVTEGSVVVTYEAVTTRAARPVYHCRGSPVHHFLSVAIESYFCKNFKTYQLEVVI